MSKSAYGTIVHRDGNVSLWNVYTQQRETHTASDLVRACDQPFGNLLLPTLNASDRKRIIRIAERA